MTRFAQKAWRKVAVPLNYHISDSGITQSYRMKPVSGEVPNLVTGTGNLSKVEQSTFSNSLLGESIYFPFSGVWEGSVINPLPFFCSMWVRLVEYSAANQLVGVKYRSDTNAYYFGLAHFNTNSWGLFDYGSVASNLVYRVTGSASLPLPWQHIVWGRSADNTLKMWVDGQPSANNFVTTNPWTDPAPGNADERFGIGGRRSVAGTVSLPANADIGLTELYNSEMTDAKALQLYREGARAIQFATDWGHRADGVTKNPDEWISECLFVAAGSGRGTTSTIRGSVVKVVESQASPLVAVGQYIGVAPNELPYGSWSWWANTNNDTYSFAFMTNEDITEGYFIGILPDGSGGLFELPASTLLEGFPAGTFDTNNPIHLHVTRDFQNRFTTYYNGVALSAGVVDSTYTNMNNFAINANNGSWTALADEKGQYAITKYLGVVPPTVN